MKVFSQEIEIRGTPQWVYITPGKKNSPALLFLHGGPGWADAPWAHRSCSRLWGEITTVHWDQRGANRSLSNPLLNLTIDDMVQDTLELAKILKAEHSIKDVLLVGHSWGALLGALSVAQAPQLFSGFIGIGQLVSNAESEPISLDYCLKKSHLIQDPTRLARLESLTPRFYQNISEMFFQREILFHLGGEFHQTVSEAELKAWTVEGPPEYQSTIEILYKGCEKACEALWTEMISYDLFKQIKRLDVPMYLFAGRHDYVTASSVAEKWFNQLEAPAGKELVWFENSGHWPQLEENQKFSEQIQRILSHF